MRQHRIRTASAVRPAAAAEGWAESPLLRPGWRGLCPLRPRRGRGARQREPPARPRRVAASSIVNDDRRVAAPAAAAVATAAAAQGHYPRLRGSSRRRETGELSSQPTGIFPRIDRGNLDRSRETRATGGDGPSHSVHPVRLSRLSQQRACLPAPENTRAEKCGDGRGAGRREAGWGRGAGRGLGWDRRMGSSISWPAIC